MTGIVIKVTDADQCPQKLDIHQHGILINQIQCTLPTGHPGFHRCAAGVWSTQDRLQSIIENEGRSL